MQRIPKEQPPSEPPRPKPQTTEPLAGRGFPSETEPQHMGWLTNKGFKNPRLVTLWIKGAALAAFTWGSWEACMWWISRRDDSDLLSSQNIVRVMKPKPPVDKQKPKPKIQKHEEQKYFD